MKNYLKTVSEVQEILIKHLKDIKRNVSLGNIAGASMPGNGEISFSNYVKILDNIEGHKMEHVMFNHLDPNQIMFEKNFLMNCLSLGNNRSFFLFRTSNDEGITYIDVPNDFFMLKPVEPNVWFLTAPFFTFVISLIAVMIINHYLLVVLGLLISIILWYFSKKSLDKFKKKKKDWKEMYESIPNLFLKKRPYSFTKEVRNSGNLSGIKTKLNISFNENVNKVAYEKTLSNLITNAHKMKGKIVWLWFYEKRAVNECSNVDLSNINYISKYNNEDENHYYNNQYTTITIDFNLKSYYLIPAIETEHSLIFSLEHFQDRFINAYAHDETMRLNDAVASGVETVDIFFKKMFLPVD